MFDFDRVVLLLLNSLVPASHLGAKLFYFPADNSFVRGFPIFFPLAGFWFSERRAADRGRILIGVFTACFVTIFSVWLQSHNHMHIRPFLDPTLHLRGMELVRRSGWDHLSSFPSDTGTLLFALSTIVLIEHRIAGGIAFAWSFLIAGVIRVAVGWHYPSDVLGSLVLGCVPVILLMKTRPLRSRVDGLLEQLSPHMAVVHALMFFLLADALSLFTSALQFIHGIRDIAHLLLRHS